MLHEADWQRIARYALGECSAEEAISTSDWIDADPERKALAVELIRIAGTAPAGTFDAAAAWERFRSAEGIGEIDAPGIHPLAARAAARRSTPRTPARRTSPRRLLLAASIALALLASALVWRIGFEAPSTTVALEDLRTVTTQARQRSEIYLSDGTRVMLGAASTIRFAERFGTRRDVFLEGEAYFDVADDRPRLLRRPRPFAVHTEHGVARDIGTRFTVRATPDAPRLEVVVAEGIVALHRDAEEAASREMPDSLLLHAGDMGVLDRGELTVTHDVDVSAHHAWLQGRLVFTDATLADVIDQFRRWYGIELQAGDSSLADARLTATFDIRSRNAALDLLAAVLDVRLVRTDDTAVLYRNRGR